MFIHVLKVFTFIFSARSLLLNLLVSKPQSSDSCFPLIFPKEHFSNSHMHRQLLTSYLKLLVQYIGLPEFLDSGRKCWTLDSGR